MRPWTAPTLLTLAPAGLADYEPILGPAREFAAKHPGDCVSYHVLGPYGYRAGRYEEAAAAAPPPGSTQAIVPEELVFLAMASARLGDKETARRKLDQLQEIPWRRFGVWDRQRIELLLNEARLLIESVE
jgi:hypothetical protein